MESIPIVVPERFAGRGRTLHAALWATQWMLAAVFYFAGLLKTCVPVEDLQHKLQFVTNAPAAILRPVGVLEIIASLALILPAATQVLPRLTPIAATCLTVIAALGTCIHASGCGLGKSMPNLVLAAAAAFVAWGRFGKDDQARQGPPVRAHSDALQAWGRVPAMDMDRRTAPRALRRLRVLVAGDVAFTADVSANGFCLETPRLAQPGTSVSGTITVGEREFEFTGMVCWTRGDDPQQGRIGMRFLDAPRELQLEFATVH